MKTKAILRNITGFGTGDFRLNQAKRNIFGGFLIKGMNIGIGLLLIPIIINYLEPTKYGIWVTLSSVIGWFGFFDIGLGNGLRNRLAEALTSGDKILARIYVSTTYAMLIIIVSAFLLFFHLVKLYIDWNLILNADEDVISHNELSLLASLVFTFFGIQFVLKLINTILTANQLSAKASLFDLLAKLLSFLFIFILISKTKESLLHLGIAVSVAPIIVFFFSSLWFFNRDYKYLKPGLKFVKFDKVKDLLTLGWNFFLIQIAVLLLYQTNIIIINQLFGPQQVTAYYVAFQYFSVLMLIFSIIVTPFWSAFTEAWVKNDVVWIESVMSKLSKLWLLLLFIGVLMLVVSKGVFGLWVGNKIVIPYLMSFLVVLWVLLNSWNSIFSQFINGVGKLKVQLYLGISSALINVPLAILLGMKWGIYGVLVSNIIVVLPGAFIYPYQYRKLITNSAQGTWNK